MAQETTTPWACWGARIQIVLNGEYKQTKIQPTNHQQTWDWRQWNLSRNSPSESQVKAFLGHGLGKMSKQSPNQTRCYQGRNRVFRGPGPPRGADRAIPLSHSFETNPSLSVYWPKSKAQACHSFIHGQRGVKSMRHLIKILGHGFEFTLTLTLNIGWFVSNLKSQISNLLPSTSKCKQIESTIDRLPRNATVWCISLISWRLPRNRALPELLLKFRVMLSGFDCVAVWTPDFPLNWMRCCDCSKFETMTSQWSWQVPRGKF